MPGYVITQTRIFPVVSGRSEKLYTFLDIPVFFNDVTKSMCCPRRLNVHRETLLCSRCSLIISTGLLQCKGISKTILPYDGLYTLFYCNIIWYLKCGSYSLLYLYKYCSTILTHTWLHAHTHTTHVHVHTHTEACKHEHTQISRHTSRYTSRQTQHIHSLNTHTENTSID